MKSDKNIFTPLRPLSSDQRHILETMKAEIRRSEIGAVSFKMFDTLVIRPFLNRSELSSFMEKEFSGLYVGKKSFRELREDAGTAVIRKSQKSKKAPEKPYLDRIYDMLMKMSGISPSSRDKLLKRECELDEYFCFTRQCGMELFREAKKCGKKVVITVSEASCPLPREGVEHILKSCGYEDYDELVYPQECGVTTCTGGNLYDFICEKTGLAPEKILHIGSRVTLDVEEPIKKGMKALLLSSPGDLMLKSGRLRPFILTIHQLDYEEAKLLSLRCVLGLYAAYAFDYPQNRQAQSDFCGDEYMLGFITLGPLSLYKDMAVSGELEMKILGAMSQNKNIAGGRDDFVNMFGLHFGSNLEKYGFEECSLPFRFFFSHGALGDRMSVQRYLSADVMEKWSQAVTEPDITPIYLGRPRKSALSRLADRLFPPGTQVRTYVDAILAKLR